MKRLLYFQSSISPIPNVCEMDNVQELLNKKIAELQLKENGNEDVRIEMDGN